MTSSMKRIILSFLLLTVCIGVSVGQIYRPVTVTGFNLDGIADADSADLTTTGTLDGNYVLYSKEYGDRVGSGLGLPNNGLIYTGTRTYQLQPYKVNNILFLNNGDVDSFVLATPASFAGLSVPGLCADGNGTNTFVVEFTDGSSTTFANLPLHDWFGGTDNVAIAGIDRCYRPDGSPDDNDNDPRIYYNDLVLSCTDQVKLVRAIVITNTGGGPETSLFGVSGVSTVNFSFLNADPTCPSGTNGTATAVATGGIPPYTYTWATSTAQHGVTASGLATGTYSLTALDSLGCTVTAHDTVLPGTGSGIAVTASSDTLCAGMPVTLTASSASSYSWSTGASAQGITVTPMSGNVYTVTATEANGCKDTASIALVINNCTGISDINTIATHVYPNPNTGTFTLTISNNASDVQIQILDLQGRVVYTNAYQNASAGQLIGINMANAENGIYILHVSAGQAFMEQKIVVQK